MTERLYVSMPANEAPPLPWTRKMKRSFDSGFAAGEAGLDDDAAGQRTGEDLWAFRYGRWLALSTKEAERDGRDIGDERGAT